MDSPEVVIVDCATCVATDGGRFAPTREMT
jgi:hypothetical protein